MESDTKICEHCKDSKKIAFLEVENQNLHNENRIILIDLFLCKIILWVGIGVLAYRGMRS